MTPALVVLTDFFAVTNRALSYAAGLAVPLHAQLILLHVRYDGLPVPEGFGSRFTPAGEAKTRQALLQLAADQTVVTTVDMAAGLLPAAVNEAVHRHHPLMVVLARPAAAPEPAELLTGVVQEVLRYAPHPLLFVPTPGEGAPFPPRRLLLAVDGQPFTFSDQDHQEVLSRLLHALGGTLDVVHVTNDEYARPEDGAVLATVRASNLVSDFAAGRLHQVYHPSVVEGVLAEAAREQADLLVVVARRHTLFGSLFHQSITARLIEQSPVPVLVLPAED